MRFPLVLAAMIVVGSSLVAALSCSSVQTAGSSSGNPSPVDGSTGDDGAIVDPDVDAATEADGPTPSQVDVSTKSIAVLGVARSYVLAVPRTYDSARSYPLVVALHGDGQGAADFRLFLGLDTVTGPDAIVAYPDGAVDLFGSYDQNVDQQLVEAVINEVKGHYTVDGSKIWAFGYSKGGFMASQLACRRPGIFTAMTTHASGAPQDADCPGIVGLAVLASEGDLDTGIGGDYNAQYWATVDGCGGARSTSTLPDCQKTDGCPTSTPVVYCKAPGVSHYPIWNQAVTVSWAFLRSL